MGRKRKAAITVKNLDIFYKEIRRFSLAKSGINNLVNSKNFHAVKNF